jgi:hypothetical protein
MSQVATQVDRGIAELMIPGLVDLGDDSAVALGDVSILCSERHMQETLVNYVAAARAAVARSWERTPIISMTTDDSNVRGMELNNSAVVLPNNIAVWMPPQVAPVGPILYLMRFRPHRVQYTVWAFFLRIFYTTRYLCVHTIRGVQKCAGVI